MIEVLPSSRLQRPAALAALTRAGGETGCPAKFTWKYARFQWRPELAGLKSEYRPPPFLLATALRWPHSRAVAKRAAFAPRARFFATAAKGTEALLAMELSELGLPRVRADRGGVYFGEVTEDAYRACLWSRIALRIHEPLRSFECRNGDDLYEGVRAIDWSPYLGGEQTLAVRAAGRSDQLTHTHFIAVRAKDAVVDQLREQRGTRPSVDRDSPDVLLFVHLARDRATVNLDYSGASLHEHGFRSREGTAPIRETLAAALVRFSGWTGDSPLLDPMCGSGTLLIEAGLWAARRAPGLSRERFGFERWSSFDDTAAQTLARLREEARAGERPIPPLFGSDTDPRAIEQTQNNAARAGLKVELSQLPFTRVQPRGSRGALLANPPYGQRLERTADLERDIDDLLARFATHTRALIVPAGFPSEVEASGWQAVYNGPIECEFRRYDASGRAAPEAQPQPRREPRRPAQPERKPAGAEEPRRLTFRRPDPKRG